MNQFTEIDIKHMSLALRLAKKGLYTAHPNPRVGCVITSNEKVIGKGWHEVTGEDHAEIMALKEAGDNARDATAYVTLEPCAHHGRTGPCCDALIKSGISEIFIACEDPFPEVKGKGKLRMEKAGIKVSNGLLEDEAINLNKGYFSRIQKNKPYVRLKLAISLDGATAMQNGESKWITGEAARNDVQKLRATSGVILTGSGTVISDNPSLTVRDTKLKAKQPIRVVLDTNLDTPSESSLYQSGQKTMIFCVDDKDKKKYKNDHVSVLTTDKKGDHINLNSVLKTLANEGINEILVESGSVLSGAFLREKLVDELVIYQAPLIMGSRTMSMFSTPEWESLSNSMLLDIKDIRKLDRDLKIVAKPVY